jgi:hypothetical protein
MNRFFSTISISDPFVLSPVEGLRGVFQQNHFARKDLTPAAKRKTIYDNAKRFYRL